MLASTYTDFGALKAFYVFAYTRVAKQRIAFAPESFGLHRRVYVYDYFSRRGTMLNPGKTFTESPPNAYSYFIVVPIGQPGIGFLGDREQLVSLGKQRISKLTDNGKVRVTIALATGENSPIVHGYSPVAPVITSIKGKGGTPTYDPAAHLFGVPVSPDLSGVAELEIRLSSRR